MAVTQTGPNLTGTGGSIARSGSNLNWSNTGNILTANSVNANAGPRGAANDGYTNYLAATNFSFALDSAAAVRGVMFEFLRFYTAPGVVTVSDSDCRIVIAGAISGTHVNPSDFAADVAQWDSAGGSTNLFGLSSLTGAQVNAANFGTGLSVHVSDDFGSSDKGSAKVDAVRATVWWELVTGGGGTVRGISRGISRGFRRIKSGLWVPGCWPQPFAA